MRLAEKLDWKGLKEHQMILEYVLKQANDDI